MSIRSVLLFRLATAVVLLGTLAGSNPVAKAGVQAGRIVVAQPVTDSSRQDDRSSRRGVLSQIHQPLFWEGRVGPEDAPTGGEPPECAAVPCDRFQLKIDLPFGTFRNDNRPGGVQIALRWFGNPGGHTLPPGVTRLLR